MVAFLEEAGIDGATMLEVGGGVEEIPDRVAEARRRAQAG
jgi:hypothetical protein